MKQGLTKQALAIILMLLISSLSFCANSSEIYDNYHKAYKEYQKAIEEKAPLAEIQKTLEEFTKAKEAYTKILPGTAQKRLLTTSDTSIKLPQAEKEKTAEFQAPQLREDIVKKPLSFPAEVASLVKALRNATTKEQAEQIISQLENYIAENPNNSSIPSIEYELAKSLEKHNIDKKRAIKLYEKLGKQKNSKVARLAKLHYNYARAQILKKQWQDSMNQKFENVNKAHANYKKSSWLAFPVKIVRGIKYLAKSASFLKDQSKEADFLLWYEAACAPFTPPVEVVYDQFKASEDSRPSDENAIIKLIYSNYDSWYARWRLLNNAQDSISMQYFIIENDAFGISLLGLLLKKAREGVKIRLMVDSRGSTKLSFKIFAKGYLQELAKEPNIEVKVYNPIATNFVGMLTDFRRIVSSNHDKIIVIDDRYSIIGGRNIADEYLVDPVDEELAWRDTDVTIDSVEVCSQLKKAFDEEFALLKAFKVSKSWFGLTGYRKTQMEAAYYCMDRALHQKTPFSWPKSPKSVQKLITKLNEQLAQYKNMSGYTNFDPFENGHVAPVKIVDKHSLSGPRNDITQTIVKLIDGSRKEIIIQNPYVVLTPRAEAALIRAGKRGVPVYVHTNSPQTSDSQPTEAMLYKDWKKNTQRYSNYANFCPSKRRSASW